MTLISDRQPDGLDEGALAPPGSPPMTAPRAAPPDVPDLWDDDDDLDETERRTVMVPVSSVTALGAVVVVLGLLLAIWVIGRAGSDESTDGVTATPVTTAAGAATPTTVTAGAPTTVAAAPTTAAAPVTSAVATPTTAAAPTIAPTTVAPRATVAAAPDIRAFCQATADYSLTSLVILGQRAVADPQAVFVAYEGMVKNAPASIAPAVERLRPLTTEVRDEIVAGRITTPEALRTWLADKAHWPAEAEWLKASQQILPVVAAQCPPA